MKTMNMPDLAAKHVGLRLAALLGARVDTAPLPDCLVLFQFGVNHTSQGDFIVDDETLANLATVQRRLGRESVPIGFEHNIDEGSEEYQRTHEPRAVAAKSAIVGATASKAIALSSISWTPEGQSKYEHFEDLSPTPLFDSKTRRIIGILSASLVRAGSVYGLTLDASAASARLSAGAPSEPALTGFDRMVAAFERENRANADYAQSGRLGAHCHALSEIDPALTGFDRTVAAFERENAARK